MKTLTHVNERGEDPRMVDVSGKDVTERTAHAQARVLFPADVAKTLSDAGFMTKKGAVLTVAQIAGVMGVKATSQLIPLCHPLSLNGCRVEITMEADEAVIDCRVSCQGKTGVEMEALTGASVAALTIYDMCKALSHDMVIRDVRLMGKAGGKRDFQRIGA
ncbi:molybdopterin/molybdenum cofactor biosynthesis protein MoaC [Gluconobacter thailandicus F149-1 = NBRC 100600]|uniref:cyclic pyranopterin monophosphate synthase n=1 Tax=Gluconobacter thailandicus NBRC 3257 TaxID=1381097 RepID=A0ABQ0ITN6_GLUTH|nr:cyclic pyranopterin monophosphate synthase MoaC [Gluconobacter thailandicus]AFW01494.1 MoaC [Gluconobacter oxydans H24]ANQ42862.1 molybdenum cofactor biosynthesis protein C [Gluconobacter oxydans]GAN90906.1 molybdopterin/molybdenum cofactor biosynthesis protein MoaC [Gluconobacter frateurii M-2]KXV54063.1 molybdenum cofactor biosynthesis protein MoaC [Gluconobacter thailandicus]GAC88819.1 molybdenum cofactor biosynthesis protein MoaC [Gluconobacter thailandicus NBRC 3255]